jgi:hypothetical protein
MRSISWRSSARDGAGFSADIGRILGAGALFFDGFDAACHLGLRDETAVSLLRRGRLRAYPPHLASHNRDLSFIFEKASWLHRICIG